MHGLWQNQMPSSPVTGQADSGALVEEGERAESRNLAPSSQEIPKLSTKTLGRKAEGRHKEGTKVSQNCEKTKNGSVRKKLFEAKTLLSNLQKALTVQGGGGRGAGGG